MSPDAMEHSPMFELPLFPLSTVLFPGMPLQLHIFEERYKQMMQLCLDRGVPFGVALIRQGAEAFGPLAEPYPIGCIARIVQVESLSEGRMNILAVGQERFRTMVLDAKKAPYLTGIVQPFPLTGSNSESLIVAAGKLKPWVQRYLSVLVKSGDVKVELDEIPDDPQTLSYLAAISLQVPNEEKQKFLSIEGNLELIEQLHSAYRREIALLQGALSRKPGTDTAFSMN
jgi:Lon protease-like protein